MKKIRIEATPLTCHPFRRSEERGQVIGAFTDDDALAGAWHCPGGGYTTVSTRVFAQQLGGFDTLDSPPQSGSTPQRSGRRSMNTKHIAQAFSGHRFADTFEHLADDVRWVLPGQSVIEGRAAVVEACNASAIEMASLASVEFRRFVTVADDRVAAVDAVGRYVSADGSVSVVSSADIYEFDRNGRVATITSYAVELDE